MRAVEKTVKSYWKSGPWLLLFIASSMLLGCRSGSSGDERDAKNHLGLPVTFNAANIDVGGFEEVAVTIDPGSGIQFDDLEFVLEPTLGSISLSRSPEFDAENPTITVIAGAIPGLHSFEAMSKRTGQLVGRGHFEVQDAWIDQPDGPRIVYDKSSPVYEDITPLQVNSVAEEFGIKPRLGDYRIQVVYVDTATRRYQIGSTDFGAWRRVFDDSSANPSVRRYFEEVSDNKLNIEVPEDSPVISLDGEFDDYFFPEQGDYYWVPKEGIYQHLANALRELVDLSIVDAIALVFMHVDELVDDQGKPDNSGKFPWARYLGAPAYTLPDGAKHIPTMLFPYGWLDIPAGYYQAIDVALHEFGHALGLPDLYRQPPERDQMSLDPMGGQILRFPHFSMYHKIRLGWVELDQVKIFDVSEPGMEAVTLIRSSLATEEVGHRPLGEALAGYRLAPRLYYLWEHRHLPTEHSPGMSEQHLLREPAVWGTELNRGRPPGDRTSPLYLLQKDNGDGYVLHAPGMKYLELDAGDLKNRYPLQVTLASIDEGTADLNFTHNESLRPEPHIRPWKEAGRLAYKSDDVSVRNARNWDEVRLEWTNPDWMWDALIDGPNRIVARVHNAGKVDAPGVKVVFLQVEWGAGQEEQDWQLVSVETVDIPAMSTVEVESQPWFPRSESGVTDRSHYCLRAILTGDENDWKRPYSVPGYEPPLLEANPDNNLAQSNIAMRYSSTASPSERVVVPFRVHNRFEDARTFRIEVTQDNPLFRTYVEHRWVEVPGKGHRDVMVYSEYVEDGSSDEDIDSFRDLPNHVNIKATTLLGDDEFSVGGSTLLVRRGDRTEIAEFSATPIAGSSDLLIQGVVRNVGTGGAAPESVVVLSLIAEDADPLVERVVMQGGQFQAVVPGEGWEQVRALYVPPEGFAESSAVVNNPNIGD